MTDFPAFCSTMAALATALPSGRQLTEATYEVYWRACAELTDEQFQHGAEVCLKRCKFFPVPVELLEAGRPNDVPLLASEAWVWLLRRARKGDLADRSLEATTAEIWGECAARALVLIGGGREIRGAWEARDEHWLRKAFVEAFADAAFADPTSLEPRPLDATPEAVKALVAGTVLKLSPPSRPTPTPLPA